MLTTCTGSFPAAKLPLLDSTRHMLGTEEMKRMKDGAIIINTARGGLIDDDVPPSAKGLYLGGHLTANVTPAYDAHQLVVQAE